MNNKTPKDALCTFLLASSAIALPTQAAVFAFETTSPVFFEARWGITDYWSITEGTDDGTVGIPDGNDSFVIDRNPNPVNETKLTLDGGGVPSPLTVSKITATGAPGIDIQGKTFGFTVGDLELRSSLDSFHINQERDQSLIINGLISGPGDLVLSRNGGFSDGGVTPDEVFLLGGSSPNTMTGSLSFLNLSNGAQPSFWVADKVGAFGQASNMTISVNGTEGGTSIAQLVLTANTIGGEGAIDDNATSVFMGLNAEFNVADGVNEVIGTGLTDG